MERYFHAEILEQKRQKERQQRKTSCLYFIHVPLKDESIVLFYQIYIEHHVHF